MAHGRRSTWDPPPSSRGEMTTQPASEDLLAPPGFQWHRLTPPVRHHPLAEGQPNRGSDLAIRSWGGRTDDGQLSACRPSNTEGRSWRASVYRWRNYTNCRDDCVGDREQQQASAALGRHNVERVQHTRFLVADLRGIRALERIVLDCLSKFTSGRDTLIGLPLIAPTIRQA